MNFDELFQRLPEQIVGEARHWHLPALALAVKRTDHIVG